MPFCYATNSHAMRLFTAGHMARCTSSQQQFDDSGASDKFRTTPIASTITHVKSLPKSAIIYRCDASQYWQFRVFMDGKQSQRTTKEADKAKALQAARIIFGQMLQSANEGHTPPSLPPNTACKASPLPCLPNRNAVCSDVNCTHRRTVTTVTAGTSTYAHSSATWT